MRAGASVDILAEQHCGRRRSRSGTEIGSVRLPNAHWGSAPKGVRRQVLFVFWRFFRKNSWIEKEVWKKVVRNSGERSCTIVHQTVIFSATFRAMVPRNKAFCDVVLPVTF
jgi:hypothetical protein